jgi:hypothetical protein
MDVCTTVDVQIDSRRARASARFQLEKEERSSRRFRNPPRAGCLLTPDHRDGNIATL